MTLQLRIYTINKGEMDQFVREWEQKLRPLREKIGFRVHGAWTNEAANQFIWLLGYEGSETWESQDSAYFNSPERKAMQPDPARLIARTEHYFVKSVMK